MKLLFESYSNAYVEKDTSLCNQLSTSLGFAQQLKSLAGYDPMSLSPVFAATQRLTNAIGMMPWELKAYEEQTIPPRHYFYHLFDDCIQTQFMFMKNIIKDIITNGNGYALIVRDPETAKPKSLIYLPAGTCSPIYYQNTGKLYYNIPLYNAKRMFEPLEVLHFFMDSKDGIEGRPLLDFADKSIKLAGYTEKAALDYFGSGMRLTGVLSTDAPRLTDKQREEIRKNYLAGIESENGIAVLEANMRFEQLSNNARDSQLIDSRLYNVSEIARFFNINPTLLGDLSHNLYGSIEAAGLDFVTNTLAPWVKMIEDELNRKLIMPNERNKFYISLNEDVIIKSDRNSYATYLSTLIKTGLLSINEGREMLGLPKIEDGDKYVIPYSGTTEDPSYNNKNQLNQQQLKTNIDNNKEDEKSSDSRNIQN